MTVEKAYVSPDEVVLDPTRLDHSVLEKFGDTPWCQTKQWVLIGRYAGARFKLEDGAEVRIINDDEVIGTITNPDDIRTIL